MELIVHSPGGRDFIPDPAGLSIVVEHGALILKRGGTLVKAWAPGHWYTIEMKEKPA